MSKASDELEERTAGDVPTPDEVIAATAQEAADVMRHQRRSIEVYIRQDPLKAVFYAAGAGFLIAVLLRRL